ncbi:MAG: hypothetical protein IMZ61_06400 [Planctomycetes bacterium]|nr:hypothetical protein [Thermoplasmata archaeon]MBE3143537.1 hypothetical protein [Planctomycetota bacterium]
MDENEQVVTDEQAQTETEEQPEVDWKAKADELQTALDAEKSRSQGLDKKVTRMQTQSAPVDELRQEVAYLSEAIKAIAPRVGGGFEGAPLEAELQRLDGQRTVAMNMLAAYNNAQAEIVETLEDAGIAPDSLEGQKILTDFNAVKQAKTDPRPVLKEAKRIAKEKIKSSGVPDIAKLTQEITEQVKKQLIEENKKSPSMKVDTGSPAPSPGSFAEKEARFSRGEISYEDYAKARRSAGF